MSTSDASKPVGDQGLRGSERSGYLCLALTAFLFMIPFLPTAVAPVKMAMGLAALVSAIILGARGICKGREGGKVAAWLALAVLSFTLPVCALIEAIRFCLVLGEGSSR